MLRHSFASHALQSFDASASQALIDCYGQPPKMPENQALIDVFSTTLYD